MKLAELNWKLLRLSGSAYVAYADTFERIEDYNDYTGIICNGCDISECEATVETDPDHVDVYGRHSRRFLSKYWPLKKRREEKND